MGCLCVMGVKVGVIVMWMATWPEVGELMVTEQVPAPAVVQVLPPTKPAVAPLLLVRLKVTSTPLVTTRPLPSPLSVLTVAVMRSEERRVGAEGRGLVWRWASM